MAQKFYRCEHCGNIIAYVENKGVPVVCCGQKMTELIPNTSDGAGEKHVPVFTVTGNQVHVQIGAVIHPMLEAHHIAWISIETKQGNQRKVLAVDGKPEADFALANGDELVAVYAYCNLHGLWKAEA